MKILKTLGSLSLAVFLISSLGLILIVSTTVESLHGTPFAQRFFYNNGWFDVFLALFFVNILCATLTRWPFKKHHTGFVTTHIGILMLLVGSLLSRLVGVDGQMALFEHEAQDHILQNTYQLVVHRHSGEKGWTHAMDLERSARGLGKVRVADTPVELAIDDIWDDAVEASETVAGPAGSPANPAIQFTLSSERTGLHDTLWLVAQDPLNPDSSQVSLGPATVSLKTKKPGKPKSAPAAASGPSVSVVQTGSGKEFSFPIDPLPKTPFALGDLGLTVTELAYFPDARVDNNKLVTVSAEPNNPAVEFTVTDPAGKSERHTKFVLFPDFESLHAKRSAETHFDLEVSLQMPESALPKAGGLHADLTFYGVDGAWSFISKGSTGGNEGPVETGKTYTTGWMDFSFKIEQLVDRAVVRRVVRHAQTGEKGALAARVSLKENGRTLVSEWVSEARPFQWDPGTGPIVATIGTKRAPVPFSLRLEDFRKVDYPGTANAASYESDVTLEDAKDKVTIKKTISMNKPLDYKGYRIFQSSYIQGQMGEADTSIFTIAKNPGIELIYGGSIIMFLGVIIIFYIRPLSSFSQVNGKGAKRK